MLCLLCWKTLQEILDIRTIVPPIHFRLLPAATTAAASQGALTKEGIHRCQTTRNIAGCTEGIACHYLTGICPDGSLWQGCCCCCFPYTKAHKRSEFKLAEGWVCSHCSTWPSGWLNHSIRQMWLSLLPPSKCYLLTCWDKLLSTAESSTILAKQIGQHCATGSGHSRQDHLLGSLCCWGNEASVTVHT